MKNIRFEQFKDEEYDEKANRFLPTYYREFVRSYINNNPISTDVLQDDVSIGFSVEQKDTDSDVTTFLNICLQNPKLRLLVIDCSLLKDGNINSSCMETSLIRYFANKPELDVNVNNEEYILVYKKPTNEEFFLSLKEKLLSKFLGILEWNHFSSKRLSSVSKDDIYYVSHDAGISFYIWNSYKNIQLSFADPYKKDGPVTGRVVINIDGFEVTVSKQLNSALSNIQNVVLDRLTEIIEYLKQEFEIVKVTWEENKK